MSKRNRSAVTGQFVKVSYGNKHPTTTVTETVKSLNRKRPKK